MARPAPARPVAAGSSTPPETDEDVPVARMSPSLSHFAPAFVRVQAALLPVVKNANNPHFGNDFADLAAILNEALPLLNDNGFSLLQFPTNERGQLALMSMLIHESGQFIAATMPLLLQKNDPQGEGSAITYGRRYAACAILGIRTADDDGNAGSQRPPQRVREPQPSRGRQRGPVPHEDVTPADDDSPDETPQPPPAKAEGWADGAAEAAAHKAVADAIKTLYEAIPADHPVRAEIKAYRAEHGWPMSADNLKALMVTVAKATTLSEPQEAPETPKPSKPRAKAPSPAPAAPSVPTPAPEGEMPWDGMPDPESSPAEVVCPWCENPVLPTTPSVVTGGAGGKSVEKWHKDCFAEKEAEVAGEDDPGRPFA